jgi:hypothetical protein
VAAELACVKRQLWKVHCTRLSCRADVGGLFTTRSGTHRCSTPEMSTAYQIRWSPYGEYQASPCEDAASGAEARI